MYVSVGITTFCHHLESIHAAQRIPRINPAHHFVRKCKIFNFSRVSWSLRRWSWAWAAPESEARMSPMMCRYAEYLLEGGARMSSLTSEFKAEHQYHSLNLVMGLSWLQACDCWPSIRTYWCRSNLFISWLVCTLLQIFSRTVTSSGIDRRTISILARHSHCGGMLAPMRSEITCSQEH